MGGPPPYFFPRGYTLPIYGAPAKIFWLTPARTVDMPARPQKTGGFFYKNFAEKNPVFLGGHHHNIISSEDPPFIRGGVAPPRFSPPKKGAIRPREKSPPPEKFFSGFPEVFPALAVWVSPTQVSENLFLWSRGFFIIFFRPVGILLTPFIGGPPPVCPKG